MLRSSRLAVLGAALALGVIPAGARAQNVVLNSCATPGVCGWAQAIYSGTTITVRLQNRDNVFGSALYTAQIGFANALGSPLGTAFNVTPSVFTVGNVTTIGNTADGFSYGGVGGSSLLDLSSFGNVFIEGPAASSFRPLPGDPDAGVFVTNDLAAGGSYVQFTADLAGIAGVSNNRITSLSFSTDIGTVTTPEPASLALMATGLLGLGVGRRRRRQSV